MNEVSVSISASHTAGADWPAGGGDLGRLIRTRDWSGTSLGPVAGWPQSLKTATDLLLHSPVPIVLLWGENGVMIYNDAYSIFAGGRHPELLGSKVREGWPEVADFNDNVMRVGLAGGTLAYRDQELTLYRHGRPEQVSMNLDYSPVPGEDGRPAGVIAIVIETTERVLAERRQAAAEEALRAERDRFRAVLENMGEGFILLDREFRVLDINAEGMRLEGRSREDILGLSHWEAWPGSEGSELGMLYKRAMAERTPVALEHRYVWPDGREAWVDLRAFPHPEGLALFYRDVTSRKRADATAREINERYRLAGQATNDAIWDWRLDTGDVIWNDAVATLFGHENAAAGTSASWWLDHIHPDDFERIDHDIHAVIDGGGTTWVAEYRFRRADGGYADVLDRGAVLRDADGRPLRMIGAMQDLTERRAQARSLEESNRLLDAVLDAMPVGIVISDADGRIVRTNPGNTAIWGEVPATDSVDDYAEWVGYWPDTGRRIESREWALARAVERGEVCRGELVEIERFDGGGRRFIINAGAPVRDASGAVVRALVSQLDVTDRVLAERELQQLNDTLEGQVAERTAERNRLWELSRDLVLRCGFDGRIIAVNPAWGEVLGWREDELVGRSLFDLIHPDDLRHTEEGAARHAEGRSYDRFDNRYRCKNGSYRWLSWSTRTADGVINAIGRDVTADREREAELETAQEALRQAQKMEAVGQLTGGIAHDFNNLLTGVIGSLDMMQRRIAKGETDRIERYATTAMTAANRAAALTHRLLAFSRRQPLDPKPVNANRLVTGMEELLRRTIGEAIALEIVTAGGLWQTLCDPHQLESAILNLAINARDAMPDGGRITVETCNAHLDNAYAAQQRDVRPGQYICICVTDTGTGMSKETIEKAFEPFFTTKPIGQGTGLGLSMIYGFTRQSEGYARIYSELGRGTTIKLYLPRYYGEAEAAEDQHGELTDAHRAEAGEVVLVVEDETAVRDLVVDVLEELGYRAVEAADGPTGLKLLQSNMRVDLLVTDIGLPGLNGRQVADGARQQRPDLKVLFMTGYAENATIANGFLEPGMRMITKPFAVEALATRIRDMIEEA